MTIIAGRDERTPFDAEADVAIVGSGASGAVVARELARAGLSVIVLEEGGYHPPEEYAAFSPGTALRTLMRDAGLGMALGLGDTPLMSVLAGRCVGGSSVLTGGVCFRVPDDVLRRWSVDLGLAALAPEAFAPWFEAIERDLQVTTVPEHLRSRLTELFLAGADKLGIPMKALRRNTPTCKGAARCNFGCPNHAKMSVDVAMLPEARARGAVILADALVERIDAGGVRGRFLSRGPAGADDARDPRPPFAPSVPFRVRARAVVLAAGALHTPGLLARSGLGSHELGRNLTLHPAFRVGAIFDERVDGWDGAMQSVYSDHFTDEGLTLIGVYPVPSILAAAFPGVGRAHRQMVRSLPHLAFFGAMLHDDPGGRVRHLPLLDRWSREPTVTYRMSDRDRHRLWRGIGILGEMAFAAGARAVLLPVFGTGPIERPEDLRALLAAPPPARKVECMSFHPLGTARMSAYARGGVVDPLGRLWRAANVWVVDGSILPTSLGVNSQLPIMANALRIAHGLAEELTSRRAA